MKIRIKGNAIRYRLTKTDVATFCHKGYLEEAVNFGDDKLIYALQIVDQDGMSASFAHNKIMVSIPVDLANGWDNNDRVGFDKKSGDLYILIEKDFQCLDDVVEDQSDNYPNPLAFK